MSGGTAALTATADGVPPRGLRRVRAAVPATAADGSDYAGPNSSAIPILLFLIGLVIPWIIYIGPLRMSVYRIVLLFTLVPCLMMWLTGAAGRIKAADIAILLMCVWSAIALGVVHGADGAIQSGGMFFIETAGAWFLARCFIRSADDFHRMVRVFFIIVLVLLPFALYEAITGFNLSRWLAGQVLPVPRDIFMDKRWGFRRVQAVYEHPILFGVSTGSIFALTYMVLGYGKSLFERVAKAFLVILTSFLAFSSGPTTALFVQCLLIGWDNALRAIRLRWAMLGAGALSLYVAVSVGSNQTFFAFFVHYFAFSKETGWDRIRIWHYGWLSVRNHPLFGIGHNEYERPEWMEPSIDMFWLYNHLTYGIPTGALMLFIFFATVVPTILKTNLPGRLDAYRMGWLFAMGGLFVVGWTVHFWNATYVLFLFLLGSGAWFTEVGPGSGGTISKGRER